MPYWSSTQSWDRLLATPSFFCDAMVVCRDAAHQQACAPFFQAIDPFQTRSYMHAVVPDFESTASCMAALLSHPLQRAALKDRSFSLDAPNEDLL